MITQNVKQNINKNISAEDDRNLLNGEIFHEESTLKKFLFIKYWGM